MRQVVTAAALSVCVVGIFGPGIAEAQPTVKHAIVVPMNSTHTKQQWRQLSDAIEAQVVGQECTGVGPDRFCQYYTLIGLPLDQVVVVVQMNPDLANNLINELERSTTLYRFNVNGSPLSDAENRRRGMRQAWFNVGAMDFIVLTPTSPVPNPLVFDFLGDEPEITGIPGG